ncbi:MAG: arginine repressor [Acidobacteria bacterium]|nr:arginine repressor [Acidobacteriota bacterium]MBI3655485.1 arginine repressor [Acidobacteriota bacterium]
MPRVEVTKKVRQARIAQLIARSQVFSQQGLAEGLVRFGIQVTQATLSRDLTELGVIKGPHGYEVFSRTEPEPRANGDLKRVVREFVRSMDSADHLIVVQTDPGNAHTVAAHIDRAQWPEIVGTIAGDDTIFIALKRPRVANKILARLREVLRPGNGH